LSSRPKWRDLQFEKIREIVRDVSTSLDMTEIWE